MGIGNISSSWSRTTNKKQLTIPHSKSKIQNLVLATQRTIVFQNLTAVFTSRLLLQFC